MAIEAIAAPAGCPFCKSVEVTTTAKVVNVSTYWRCTACGQIWNAGRLQQERRTPSGRFVFPTLCAAMGVWPGLQLLLPAL